MQIPTSVDAFSKRLQIISTKNTQRIIDNQYGWIIQMIEQNRIPQLQVALNEFHRFLSSVDSDGINTDEVIGNLKRKKSEIIGELNNLAQGIVEKPESAVSVGSQLETRGKILVHLNEAIEKIEKIAKPA